MAQARTKKATTKKKEFKKYSASEKQAYHNALSKKGATKVVNIKGIPTRVEVSDFERGAHKAKADMITKRRMATWKKHNK